MSLEIEVYGRRKGSNPGTTCSFALRGGRRQDYYLKYCPGSKLPPSSYLTPPNQPIYESVTSEMANMLGLLTPNASVVEGSDVVFTGQPQHLKKINANMPFFFVSKLIHHPEQSNGSESLEQRMTIEAPYRDLLMVSDIIGRKQNYAYYENQDRLIYLDLGCSFVNATKGFLYMKNHIKRRPNSKKIKKLEKRLKGYYIAPMAAGINDFISLQDFVQIPRTLEIPIIDSKTGKRKKTPVSSLLYKEEIDEIIEILTYELVSDLSKLKKTGILLKE